MSDVTFPAPAYDQQDRRPQNRQPANDERRVEPELLREQSNKSIRIFKSPCAAAEKKRVKTGKKEIPIDNGNHNDGRDNPQCE